MQLFCNGIYFFISKYSCFATMLVPHKIVFAVFNQCNNNSSWLPRIKTQLFVYSIQLSNQGPVRLSINVIP
jgi:hypothetical protein